MANGNESPGVAGLAPCIVVRFRHPPPEDDHDIFDDTSLHSIWCNLSSAESIILIWTLSSDGCDRAFRAPSGAVIPAKAGIQPRMPTEARYPRQQQPQA